MTKRATGSFYTPSDISDFIIKRVSSKHLGQNLSILEPSAGDGAFVSSVYDLDSFRTRIAEITAVEINPTESKKISNRFSDKTLTVRCEDFLIFQKQLSNDHFDIIVGNPPYVKKNLLSAEQINDCQNIHNLMPNLSNCAIKNIWSAFLVRCISLLKSNGVLSFVLPAELLQVNFTKELRLLLIEQFERVEIFTFNELLFKECKGQDTIVLIAQKKSQQPGLFFHNVINLKELKNEDFVFIEKDLISTSKWTTHCLNQSEIDLIARLGIGLPTIAQLSSSKPGVVTGANKFFILNKSDIDKYNLTQYAKPIIQKGAYVKLWIQFDRLSYELIAERDNPSLLVDLNNVKLNKNSKINEYLSLGISQKIHQRYKTLLRKNWYEVPNIGKAASGLFFKRSHEFPKFVHNEANVLATDSAYLVEPNPDIDIKSLVLSFYNSLTLINAELSGRFYGGGVLELTPNEFKSLPIPYVKFSESELKACLNLFGGEKISKKALKSMDEILLKKIIPQITDEEITTLEKIRKKLVSRRRRL